MLLRQLEYNTAISDIGVVTPIDRYPVKQEQTAEAIMMHNNKYFS